MGNNSISVPLFQVFDLLENMYLDEGDLGRLHVVEYQQIGSSKQEVVQQIDEEDKRHANYINHKEERRAIVVLTEEEAELCQINQFYPSVEAFYEAFPPEIAQEAQRGYATEGEHPPLN